MDLMFAMATFRTTNKLLRWIRTPPIRVQCGPVAAWSSGIVSDCHRLECMAREIESRNGTCRVGSFFKKKSTMW
jgi:hypothetical protein